MTTKRTPPKRATRTKQETAAEMDNLEVPERGELSEQAAKAVSERQSAVRAHVADLTPEKVLAQVTATQLLVGKTLQEVQGKLIEEVQNLQTVQEAVKLEKWELERLHGVDVVAASLVDLADKYKQQNEELEQQFTERQEEQATYFANERETLTAKHTAAEAVFAQQQADQVQQRQREEADFKYFTALNRKQEADGYNEAIRQRNLQEQERQRTLDLSWNAREGELAKKEAYLKELEGKVAAFPAEQESAVKRAEAIVGNSMKRDYTHQMEMAKKDSEAQIGLLHAKVQSQQEAAVNMLAQIERLQLQVEAANEKVTTISQKALEASSGQAALTELRNAQNANGANGRQQGKA